MTDSFLSEVFFPIIRAGLGLPPGVFAREDPDFQNVIEIGKRHSVLPIVWTGLDALGLSEESPKEAGSMRLNDIFLFAQRDLALESIVNCFEKNQIDYVLLKGSVLRDLYPEQWMRTSCDVDVLVREEALDSAVDALKRETDFTYVQRLYHDVSMTNPNVHLELHFSIKEGVERIDGLLSRAWDYAVGQEGSCRFVFSPEYQIFHVVAHMAYHFTQEGLGIRPFIDLWLLRHRTEYDESAVRELCRQCGILVFYEECCRLSEVWLEGKEHTPVTKALEEYSIKGGVFGSYRNLILSKKRKHRGIGFYFSRLFVSSDTLKEIYPKAKKYPVLLSFYQIRRWLRALFCRRKDVLREIKSAKNTSNSELESFDQLMKSLGL